MKQNKIWNTITQASLCNNPLTLFIFFSVLFQPITKHNVLRMFCNIIQQWWSYANARNQFEHTITWFACPKLTALQDVNTHEVYSHKMRSSFIVFVFRLSVFFNTVFNEFLRASIEGGRLMIEIRLMFWYWMLDSVRFDALVCMEHSRWARWINKCIE